MTRSWWLIALLLSWGMAVMAQPEMGEYAPIQGTVTGPEGVALAQFPVRIYNGELVVDAVTNAAGQFGAMVPVGQMQVALPGNQPAVAVTVTAGHPNVVKLTATGTGVVVWMGYPKGGVPAVVQCTAAFHGPGAREGLAGEQRAPGCYWFAGIPATASDFTLVGQLVGQHGGGALRRTWQFAEEQRIRVLRVEIGRPVPFTVRLMDAEGRPVRNTPCQARISYAPVTYTFATETPQKQAEVVEVVQGVTDGAGDVALGEWVPQAYTLTMRTDGAEGQAAACELDTSGKVTPAAYVLHGGRRRVAQTVYGVNGEPVPGARVWLSYCWFGRVQIRQATADARGRVTWDDLPLTEAIVWGQGVPAGQLGARAVEVTMPLPPPIPGPVVAWQLVPGSGGTPFAPIAWFTCADWMSAQRPMSLVAEVRSPTGGLTQQVRVGTPIGVAAILQTTPPRFAYLEELYLPPADTMAAAPVQVDIPFEECADLRLHFALPDGAAIGVSRLTVDTDTHYPALAPDTLARYGILDPHPQPDGSYAMALPPGTARLLVDLFDTVGLPPRFVVEAKPGTQQLRIMLPAPLVMVPGGTDVHWLSAAAPAEAQRLTAAARGGTGTPIFGDRSSLLALWYSPRPDRLEIENLLTPAPTKHSLALRTVYLRAVGSDGAPYAGAVVLQPLLPVVGNEVNTPYPRPEATVVKLSRGGMGVANLWTGRYAYGTQADRMVGTMEVTADGAAEVVLPMAEATPVAAPTQVRLILPKRPPAVPNVTPCSAIQLTYNIPGALPVWQPVAAAEAGGITLAPPAGATAVSLVWVGVGYLREVPLPTQKPGATVTVALPAWQTGTALGAQMLGADGAPMRERPVYVLARIMHEKRKWSTLCRNR